jgi:hypothetical protein
MPSTSKIFGIGLQRTGTTSLHRALQMLGYRSVHGPFGLYPDLDPSIMDCYDAFSDNPIPLLYPLLDQAYPGSKFICTTRDMASWLKSVKWLFSVGRLESNWQAAPVIDAVHAALYGTSDFDEPAFRTFWHVYHAGVRRHFADRPQDLLMLDFTAGDGWEPLCAFLGHPVPGVAFPRSNQTSYPRTLIALVRSLSRRLTGWKLTEDNMR